MLGKQLGVGLRLVLVKIGAHTAVDLFNIGNAALQLCGALVVKLRHGFACGFKLCQHARQLRTEPCDLRLQGVGAFLYLVLLLAQSAVLAVFGKYFLLLFDQFRGRHRLRRRVGIIGQLLGELTLLVADPADGEPLVVEPRLFVLERIELVAHADDAQQGVGFFFVVRVHEAR